MTGKTESKGFELTEDWTVVIIGFAIIIFFLAGILIPSPSYAWKNVDELTNRVLSSRNLLAIVIQFTFMLACVVASNLLTARPVNNAFAGFPVIFLLTVVALIIAGSKVLRDLNLESVIISLAVGLLVRNLLRLPNWVRDSLTSELFVKIGLVMLGTNIIFGDLVKAGSLGLIQALAVVISVWYFAYWISKRLNVDEELALMISSAVSICGVSAAIATAGTIKGDTKKLSYVISLVLITAIPMMIFMPVIAREMGLSQEVTGAWLGGTIDTTGAVVASGSLVGETALKVSTIVKFSQNVLLGLAAFAIGIYWTYKPQKDGDKVVKPTAGVIWERFPKFVIGFVAASVIFSFALSPSAVGGVKDGLKTIQTLWFTLAFTSIGLETKLSDIFNSTNQRPTYAFLIAQGFNILVTLVIAYFLFG